MTKETFIELIIQFMTNNNQTGIDFREPYVKPSLRYVYPLFMFLHTTVGVVGIAGNAAMVIIIGKHRLYQDQTYFLMINLAMADLIKCMVVLPITLANLLIQNWLFGSFLCFFLPMLQYFPVHVSMLTFLTIAIDRYRLIVHPFKSRLPAGLCIIAVWVGAACVVLPYAIYIKYIDLGAMLGDRFIGVGICYVFVEKRIEEYIRAMFVILYAMPLAVIALLYVRISAEIKNKESVYISAHFAQNQELGDNSHRFSRSTASNACLSTHHHQEHHPAGNQANTHSNMSSGVPSNSVSSQKADCMFRQQMQSQYQRYCQGHHGEVSRMHSYNRYPSHSHTRSYNERSTQDSDEDIDIAKEKRTQNYLITMTTLFAACWCPLHILILVNYFVHENEINMSHYDITYILFTWFGFLSTCSTPVLFASWFMPDATKDRLKGYFRFSNRRRSSSSTQRRRCQARFSDGTHNTHFDEGMTIECRSLERYGCDSV